MLINKNKRSQRSGDGRHRPAFRPGMFASMRRAEIQRFLTANNQPYFDKPFKQRGCHGTNPSHAWARRGAPRRARNQGIRVADRPISVSRPNSRAPPAPTTCRARARPRLPIGLRWSTDASRVYRSVNDPDGRHTIDHLPFNRRAAPSPLPTLGCECSPSPGGDCRA